MISLHLLQGIISGSLLMICQIFPTPVVIYTPELLPDSPITQVKPCSFETVDTRTDSAPDEETKKQKLDPRTAKIVRQNQIRQAKIARALAIYHTRYIDADVLRPWSIMHGLIAYGQDTLVMTKGRTINAVEYLCKNGIGDDRRLLTVVDGKLKTNVGRGYQGHEGQLLAMFAQSGVPIDHPMRVEGQDFTVRDLVEYEKLGVESGTELTFRLIGLSYYVDSNEVWKNKQGQKWNIERMINEEIAQPVRDGACGGSHRLMSLSYAVRTRHDQGQPINGQWQRARNFVRSYQKRALSMQNSDGSFSTSWFEGPGNEPDKKLKLYTTGHILEWLVYSLPTKQLSDPRITRAVNYLLKRLLSAPSYQLDVGPRGHAIHALRIYEERAFGQSSDVRRLSAQDVAELRKTPIQTTAVVDDPNNEETPDRLPIFNRRRNGRRVFGGRR